MRALDCRWALSFADLCLLLLGFFVLLQAQGGDGRAVTAGVRAAFGEAPVARPLDLPATDLFEPGEAILRPEVRRRLAALGRGQSSVTITSTGRDASVRRFDAWELAAARAAAVARAIAAGGLPDDSIAVELGKGEGKEQRLRITSR